MGKDGFDKYVHDQLKNYKIQLDTTDMWRNIEKTLPPEKTTGSYLLWTGLASLVLLISIGVWYGMANEDVGGNQRLSTAMESISPILNKKSSDIDEQKIATSESGSVGNKTLVKNTLLTNSGEEEITSNNNSSISYEKSVNSDNEIETKSLKNSERKINNKGISENNTLLNYRHSIVSSEEPISSSHNKIENILEQRFEKGSYPEESLSSDDIIVKFESSETKNQRPSLTLENTSIRQKLITNPLSFKREIMEIASLNNNHIQIMEPKALDCYSFGGGKWGWSFDVYSGLNYASKNLKRNSESTESENYLNARNNSESNLEAFEAGIAINFMHRKGYLISAGVNYAQINEKFNFFSVKTSTIFDSVVVRIDIDSSGRVDTTKEWRPVTIRSTKEIVTYNSYRTLDIPISLGYRISRGKWTYEIQGGVMLNVLFKKEGEILNNQLVVTEIAEDNFFRSNIGMSVFGSIKAIYPINNWLGIFIEPIGRFNIKSMTIDGNPLDQKYNQFGLRIGARLTI